MNDPVPLRVITPDATPEEVAAITAAIASVVAASHTVVAAEPAPTVEQSQWVHAARITARRASYTRGSWRLSGRIGRRSRA